MTEAADSLDAAAALANKLGWDVRNALDLGDYDAAQANGLELFAALRQVGTRAPATFFFGTVQLINLDVKVGGPAPAKDLLQEARFVASRLGDLPPALESLIEGAAGLIAKAAGRWDDGRASYRKAIEIAETDPTTLDEAVVHRVNLADLEEKAGNYGAAANAYRALISSAPDASVEVGMRSNLGRALSKMKRLVEADEVLTTALERGRTEFAGSAIVAIMTSLLASVAADRGDFPRAEALHLEAQRLWASIPGRDGERAQGMLNFALMRLLQDRLDEARQLLAEASALRSPLRDDIDSDVALAEARAALALDAGDGPTATEFLRGAIELYGQREGQDPSVALGLRRLLADALMAAGSRDQAREILEKDLASMPATGDQRYARARHLVTLADVDLADGLTADAVRRGREAVELWSDGPTELDPELAQVNDRLAFALAANGEVAEALDAADRAETTRDATLDWLFASQRFEDRLETVRRISAGLYLYLGCADALARQETVGAGERAFGLVLRRQAITAEAEALAKPEANGPMWAVRAEISAELAVSEPNPDRLSALYAERDRLELAAAATLPAIGFAARLRKATPGAVVAALPAGSALVNFVCYRPPDFAAAGGNPFRSENARYAAFVVSPLAQVAFVDLGPASPVDAAIGEWREAVEIGRPTHQVRAFGLRLWTQLLTPLDVHLEPFEKLVVVTDGLLSAVPLGALPWREADVFDRFHVTYLDSARDLLAWGVQHEVPSSPAYVAGGIDYDAAPAPGADTAIGRGSRLPAKSWPALKWTQPEAESISKSHHVSPALAAEPTEAAIKALRSPEIVHLATHGFFFQGVEAQALPNPMARSGIVLAGANRVIEGLPVATAIGDGIVTADDLLVANFHGTRLVVLSACQTGLGDVYGNEGIFGLRRAFAIAGAGAIIMSLWEVPDWETRGLLVAMHKSVAEGYPVGDALRESQAEVRRSNPHPKKWAAFTLVGDPGPIKAQPAAAPQSLRSE